MRTRYKITEKEGIYFATSTIVEWMPVFTSQKYCDIIIESMKYCKVHKGLKLYAYVIMDNHIHLVAKAPELSATLASFKKFTAKEIIDRLKHANKQWLLGQLAFYKKKYKTESDYQVWQEGSPPQLMLNEEILRQKIEYIHGNPVRRGMVDSPEDWWYSSYRNYHLNDHSIIRIDELLL